MGALSKEPLAWLGQHPRAFQGGMIFELGLVVVFLQTSERGVGIPQKGVEKALNVSGLGIAKLLLKTIGAPGWLGIPVNPNALYSNYTCSA